MRFTFFLVLYLCVLTVRAQSDADESVEYFLNPRKEKCPAEEGVYYRKATKKDGIWTVKDYYVAEKSMEMEGSYLDDSFRNANGTFFWFHKNKQLRKKGRFINGKKEGMWKGYSEAGNLTDSALFKQGLPLKFAYGFHDNGKPSMQGTYNEDGTGEEIAWYEDGTTDYYGKYSAPYQMDSIWTYHYRNGVVACKEYFNRGILLKMECFDESGKNTSCAKGVDSFYGKEIILEYDDAGMYHPYAEQMPEPSYNVNYFLSQNIRYPANAIEHNIQGKVNVSFVVDTNGKVSDFQLIGSGKAGGGLDEEALRVVRMMPKWKPAKYHNRPVQVFYTQPVIFRLE